jgi:transposase-like protein
MSDKTPTKTSRSRLTAAEIAEAVAMYESGTTTLEDLARKFDKVPETFHRLFKRLGVTKGAKAEEMKERVKEEVEKAVVDDAATLAQRIRETKEEHYKVAAALFKLNWNEVLQAKKAGMTLASIAPNLKAIQLAAQNFKLIRDERYAVLGINDETGDDDEIPELPIHELTQEQIEEMRKKDAEPEGDDFAFEGEGEISTEIEDLP